MKSILQVTVLVVPLFAFEALAQAGSCPPLPKAKNPQEAVLMEQTSNKNGCWIRNKSTGQLQFVGKSPNDYKPLLKDAPETPKKTPPKMLPYPGGIDKNIIGDWVVGGGTLRINSSGGVLSQKLPSFAEWGSPGANGWKVYLLNVNRGGPCPGHPTGCPAVSYSGGDLWSQPGSNADGPLWTYRPVHLKRVGENEYMDQQQHQCGGIIATQTVDFQVSGNSLLITRSGDCGADDNDQLSGTRIGPPPIPGPK